MIAIWADVVVCSAALRFYACQNLTDSVGEIHAMTEGGKKLLNPLIAAQNFEYKMSNILGALRFLRIISCFRADSDCRQTS